ncbi:unnamed protein product [Prunus armeniaca]
MKVVHLDVYYDISKFGIICTAVCDDQSVATMLNQIFYCSNGIKFFMNVVPTYVENNISEIGSNWINLAFPVYYASRHVKRRKLVAANQVSLHPMEGLHHK